MFVNINAQFVFFAPIISFNNKLYVFNIYLHSSCRSLYFAKFYEQFRIYKNLFYYLNVLYYNNNLIQNTFLINKITFYFLI